MLVSTNLGNCVGNGGSCSLANTSFHDNGVNFLTCFFVEAFFSMAFLAFFVSFVILLII